MKSPPYFVTDEIDLTTLPVRTEIIPRGTPVTQISVRKCSAGAPLRLAFGVNGQLAPFQEGDLMAFNPPCTDGVYADAVGALAGQVAVIMAPLAPDGA